MESLEKVKNIISEVEKDLTYLEKALDKKKRESFETKRFEMIEKLKEVQREIR